MSASWIRVFSILQYLIFANFMLRKQKDDLIYITSLLFNVAQI